MNTIHIRNFGVVIGTTTVLHPLGCIVVMFTAGKEGSIQFFNSLIHGIYITSIILMNVPISEAIIQIFALGGLTRASLAEV